MAEIIDKQTVEDVLISDFEQNAELLYKFDTPKITEIRQQAIAFLKENRFPSQKDELWRFTNIRKLFDEGGRIMHPFLPPDDVNTPIKEIFQCEITQLDTFDYALINGWYPKTLPLIQRIGKDGFLGSFREALELFPEFIEKHFAQYADFRKDTLLALNTAYATDGIVAFVPDHYIMEKPLQVVSLVSQPEGMFFQQLVQPRNLVVVGDYAEIRLVLCDHTLSANKSLTNIVTEIVVGEGAKVDIVRLQNQNNKGTMMSTLHIHQKSKSVVTSNTITLNGGFVRNNQSVAIDGEFAETNLYGVYLTDKHQHIDNNTFIDHQKPNSNSNELFKGILDDQATGVFRGRILVRKDAQKTNSYQSNNNLLLTDEAKMNTMPQLEIYADDVKCSHGATVGYLNSEELFYLRSRGIDEKEARLLLMNAFAGEIIDKISIPALRDRISYLVSKRLRGELSHCATCVLNCRD